MEIKMKAYLKKKLFLIIKNGRINYFKIRKQIKNMIIVVFCWNGKVKQKMVSIYYLIFLIFYRDYSLRNLLSLKINIKLSISLNRI